MTTSHEREHIDTKTPVASEHHDGDPVINRDGLRPLLVFRGKEYRVEFAQPAEIRSLIGEVRRTIEGSGSDASAEIEHELQNAGDTTAIQKAHKRATVAIEKTAEVVGGKPESPYVQLLGFFTQVEGANNLMQDIQAPYMYKLDAAAMREIIRLNKPDLKSSDANPALTNRVMVPMLETGYVLPRKAAENLKELIERFGNNKYTIVHTFEHDDGFVANLGGKNIAFFTQPPESMRLESSDDEAPNERLAA